MLQIVIWFRWADNQGVKVWSSGIISIGMENSLKNFSSLRQSPIYPHTITWDSVGLDEGLAICAVGCKKLRQGIDLHRNKNKASDDESHHDSLARLRGWGDITITHSSDCYHQEIQRIQKGQRFTIDSTGLPSCILRPIACFAGVIDIIRETHAIARGLRPMKGRSL